MTARRPLLALLLTLSTAEAATVTVRTGDTLWSLARRAGITVEQLRSWNNLDGDTIREGMTLTVSAGADTAANPSISTDAAEWAPVGRGQAVYYVGRTDSETAMTAAHPSLPFGTWVRVTHERTGRSVLVKINDRGPFGNSNRVIDLSTSAAQALGILSEGVAPVRLEARR